MAALGAAQRGVVLGRQLIAAGATWEGVRHQVGQGRLIRVRRDIYRLRDHPRTWEGDLQALLFDAGPTAVVSHRSAARLHGQYRYRRSPAVEVSGPEVHDHLVDLGGFHRTGLLPAHHVERIHGFPVTTLARTCFDLMGDPDPGLRRSEVGRQIHARNMVRVVNDAMRRRGLTLADLVRMQRELGRRGRSGSALIRQIIRELGPSYVPTESGRTCSSSCWPSASCLRRSVRW